MIKQRKDSGFTLIELMIVIAVIGILAIVLIPKVGTVKTQAKESGLDVNVRAVQGYAESKINNWVSSDLPRAQVVTDIVNAFSFTDQSKQLANPITSISGNAISTSIADIASVNKQPVIVLTGDDPTVLDTYATAEGSIVIAISDSTPITQLTIYAFGAEGKKLTEKTVIITP